MSNAHENPAVALLRQELASITDRIASITEVLKDAKANKKSYEDAIESLVNSMSQRTTRGGGVSLAERIVAQLSIRGNLSLDEIVILLKGDGNNVVPGKPSVTSALARMRKDGTVSKNRDTGKWHLMAEATPQSSDSFGQGDDEFTAEKPHIERHHYVAPTDR